MWQCPNHSGANFIASDPSSPFRILSPIFLQSCETKSRTESLGSRLPISYGCPWTQYWTINQMHRRHSLDMGSVSLVVLSKGLALILQLLVTNLKLFPANSFSSSPDKHYSQSIHRGIHYWVPILKIICRSRDTLHNISSITWYSYSKYSVSVSNIHNKVVHNSMFNQYCHYYIFSV